MTTEDKKPFKSQEGQTDQQPDQKENNLVSQEENHQERQSEAKRGWIKLITFSVLAAFIAGLIGGGVGYLWGQSFKSEADTRRYKRIERAKAEAKDTETGFITEKDRVVFTFSLKDLGLLKYNNKDGHGLTADQIVNTYGLASGVDYEKKGIKLSWDRSKSSKSQSVTMYFEKSGDNYYLKHVQAYALGEFHDKQKLEDEDEDEDEKDTDNSKDYKLTNEEFKSLKKGDSKTGKGGTPLSELLKKHGQSIQIETENDITANGEKYISNRVIAKVFYEVDDDYKTLRFLAQPNGEFLYIGTERD
ncbi:hypothetical protein K1J07_03445 [Streptococcus gordonii]|nr:hypothetical protein [Streptococcus gordonii]MBX9096960.1 hypothetical protein [Streptococcus gordonii]MBZ2147738.1 hypothetical protein [Streptococcus gordonii]MCY7132704.1 hypothetical protein [Streptococcus gordonii]RSJ30423.1 hypothetical protein D8823_05965 [Streptococcus gordonii]RSJ45280.1 hypothetical protein D8817_04060 [Streptococcus gordonii]